MARHRARAWVLLLLLGGASVAAADGTPWIELSGPEQTLLAPWAERWGQLKPEQQERLLSNARAWLKLTPEERAQFQARVGAWDAMPPAERARLRERYEAFQRLRAWIGTVGLQVLLHTARGGAGGSLAGTPGQLFQLCAHAREILGRQNRLQDETHVQP